MDKNEKNIITGNILNKYRKITEKAFLLVRKNVSKTKEKEAEEIIMMVDCYLSDSKHFQDKGDLINAFGSIYYAHGWLDCGARLRIFEVKDDKLFAV
jgi:hypothetical protein